MHKSSLLLHVGTEKTGTTAIQDFLFINRCALAVQGFVIPEGLGSDSHILLPLALYSEERCDEASIIHNLSTMSQRAAMLRTIKVILLGLVQANPGAKFILTSELLQSRLTRHEELKLLRSFLLSIFAEIKIVLYIRRPYETALSAWSTAVKNGGSAVEMPSPSDPYIANLCHHKNTISLWQGVFGNDSVLVRRYGSEYFRDRNIFADFSAVCGFSLENMLIPDRRANPRLGHEGLVILSKLNSQIPFIKDSGINPLRRNLVSYLERFFAARGYEGCSEEDKESYSSFYQDSDDWVKARFFPGEKSLWGDESVSVNCCAQETRTCLEVDERLISMFAAVWNEKHAVINNMRISENGLIQALGSVGEALRGVRGRISG